MQQKKRIKNRDTVKQSKKILHNLYHQTAFNEETDATEYKKIVFLHNEV